MKNVPELPSQPKKNFPQNFVNRIFRKRTETDWQAIIIGAGSYGQIFKYYLEEQGYTISGFVDDAPGMIGKDILGIPVIGNFKELLSNHHQYHSCSVFCTIGDNMIRDLYLRQLQDFGFNTPPFIHDTVIKPDNVTLGKAVYLLPGVKIMPFVTLGDHCVISMGSHIAHHTSLAKGVFVSTGVNIGAGIKIAEHVFIGIGATLTTGVQYIGRESIIGSGSVVIRDVEEQSIVAGVPAKVLKSRNIASEPVL